MSDQPGQFEKLLERTGPVAIVLKQYFRPAEGGGEPIFPPTYLMPSYRGRTHTVRDGEYRVSVELPPFRQANGEDKSQDIAGYNIDEFKDGTNVCEIDSPQSQANRIEPLFETILDGKLVPQVKIKVGKEQVVNLLTAGHRAADAVVRFSSLAAKFDSAFNEVRKGNHLELARLAPTSILFGVWDSRGTQVKLPRIFKSEIRATNVEKLTRSAQFNPAADFVQLDVIDEALDKGEGDKNPLGTEGMKHVPAPRAIGGVIVRGEIKQVTRINLVAIRDLCAKKDGVQDKNKTEKLQRYILGLALVAATQPIPVNLREGCLLCGLQDEKHKATPRTVNIDGSESDIDFDLKTIESFADMAAKAFFGERYDQKDHPDAIFESGVANKFLSLSADVRKKIARGGPITADAIRRFEEKDRNPLKLVSESIKDAKKTLPKKTNKSNLHAESFNTISERLRVLIEDEQIDKAVKGVANELLQFINDDKDTHATFRKLEDRIREFDKQRKEADAPSQLEESAHSELA